MADAPLTDAGVWFPPPLWFLGGAAAGWILNRQWPLALATPDNPRTLPAIALVLLVAALALIAWAFVTFRRWKTAIIPHNPATRIVQDGPFAYSRNPLYVGMTTATLGIGVLMNTLWVPMMIPIVLVLVYQMVIRREEAYLTSAFPDDYRAYCARVRRWI